MKVPRKEVESELPPMPGSASAAFSSQSVWVALAAQVMMPSLARISFQA